MTVLVTTCGHGGGAHGSGAPQSLCFFLPHSPPNRPPRLPAEPHGAGGGTTQLTVTGTHTHSHTVRACWVVTGTISNDTTSTSLVTAFCSGTFTFSLAVVHSVTWYLKVSSLFLN